MTGLTRTIARLAVEAALNPALHEYNCKAWGFQPFTREKVVEYYGEKAALAWDDLRAANKSFYRAVTKHVETVK